MDLKPESRTLSGSNPRRKDKVILLDTTIVNPRVGLNLDNAACRSGKHLTEAVERKNNEYQCFSPATYSLLSLALSTYGNTDSDLHTLTQELAIRRMEYSSEIYSEEPRHQILVEGTEIARLQRRFSFV